MDKIIGFYNVNSNFDYTLFKYLIDVIQIYIEPGFFVENTHVLDSYGSIKIISA